MNLFLTVVQIPESAQNWCVRVLYDRFRAPPVNTVQPQSQFTGTNEFGAQKYIFTDVSSIISRIISDFRVCYSLPKLSKQVSTARGITSELPVRKADC